MKKSNLILAVAVFAFVSCKKTEEVTPVTPLSEVSTLAVRGSDDSFHDANDDNPSKHSGKDDKNISVPAKVLAAFNKSFPVAIVREWKLTSDGLYKAHFTKNGIAYEASYKASGILVKLERN
jgi:hypothetical protein